jgi:hypothetical protein
MTVTPQKKMGFFAVSLGLACTVSLGQLAQAQESRVEAKWLEFQKNPRAFMERQPEKALTQEPSPASAAPRFSPKDVANRTFIDKKKNHRLNDVGSGTGPVFCNLDGVCLTDMVAGRAKAINDVSLFLDTSEFKKKGLTVLKNLQEMEKQSLMEAKLKETPWSDTYWPLAQGNIGARYAADHFIGHDFEFQTYYDIVSKKQFSLSVIAKNAIADDVDTLSPAEKYDLLIGDPTTKAVYANGFLTPKIWSESGSFKDDKGVVEPWMGICHGWAPAAFMLPRPKRSVITPSATGIPLKFYPSDLKGLGSYLWAKAQTPSNFLGGRCNDKEPATDSETGRILDEQCFDTNPGNWHVAIVNQIGLLKRSFVMDATYDYEVWNQPVYSYKYTYFNPQTGKATKSLRTATTPISKYTNDKFKKFRSKDAAYVVGVEMEVQYIVETEPTHDETNSARNDFVQSVTYMYDLELNKNKEIIGGEWYENKHPDFLWKPTPGHKAKSNYDDSIEGVWQPGQPLPAFWQDIAVKTATYYGQPVSQIVEALFDASRPKRAPSTGSTTDDNTVDGSENAGAAPR